jgi:hypothetical protein
MLINIWKGEGFMRLILKIFALPVAGILTLLVAFCTFALAISGAILGLISVVVFLLALFMTFTVSVPGGIAWMFIAFLISPLGLPRFAEWLIEKVDDINQSIKCFIAS